MGMTRVVVHINRLVLNGFRHDERHTIASGLQQELGRLFGDREAVRYLSAMRDGSRLSVGGVHFEHGSRPQHIGRNLARTISKEMKR
jgi:hypothetical protein